MLYLNLVWVIKGLAFFVLFCCGEDVKGDPLFRCEEVM